MPNLNEFFDKKTPEVTLDNRVEIIEQMRPCSTCDLFVHEYYFNNKNMEMYWTCKNGHETRHKIG